MWSQSVGPMVEYLESYHKHEAQVRLKLAHVLMDAEHRPAQALSVLQRLNPGLIDDAEAEQLQRLESRAKALQQRYPHDVADEDW